MRKGLLAAFCAFAALSASAQNEKGKEADASKPVTAANFVQWAAQSDMFEIQSGQLALQKGSDQDKTFAQQMIADHQKTTTELQGLLNNPGLHAQAPTALSNPERKKLDKLNKEDGAAFAKSYETMQLEAHKKAVALFKRYADQGDNPQLKQWASETLPTLQHHLEMAEQLGK